jgi:hypothetical protein
MGESSQGGGGAAVVVVVAGQLINQKETRFLTDTSWQESSQVFFMLH